MPTKKNTFRIWLNVTASFALIGIFLMYTLPIFKIGATAYLTTDGRWWVNQYYEYFNTFSQHGKVAFSAFNQTGLAINTFYPTLPLRWLEAPFVSLHVTNIYLVFGLISLIVASLSFFALYQIAQKLKIEHSFFVASIALVIYTAMINPGFSNSLPQYLANMFTLYGVYGIVAKKHWILAPTTFGILTTSFTTSVVASLVYLCVMLTTTQSIKDWLKNIFYGVTGLLVASPVIAPALVHIKEVASPTKEFMPTMRNFFFTSYFQTHGTGIGVHMSLRVLIPAVVLLIYITSYKKGLSKKLVLVIFAYLLTMIFPYISGILSSPVQAGTWIRTWPLIAILYLFVAQKSNYKPLYIGSSLIIIFAITSYLIGTNYTPTAKLQPNTFSKALQNDNLKQVAQSMSSDVLLKDNHNRVILKGTPKHMAEMSPDYVPKKATVEDRNLAFLPQKELYKKYGVQKEAVKNNSNKIKLRIKPAQDVTPLAVWHYSFFKYRVTSSAGQVKATDHGTFEYHGKSPAILTIEVVS